MKTSGYKTPYEISMMGFSALLEKLGPGGTLQFMHQYETGHGDYTKERKKFFKDITLIKLKKELL